MNERSLEDRSETGLGGVVACAMRTIYRREMT